MTSMPVGLIGGLVAALCLTGGCSGSNGERGLIERMKGSERVSSFGVFPAARACTPNTFWPSARFNSLFVVYAIQVPQT